MTFPSKGLDPRTERVTATVLVVDDDVLIRLCIAGHLRDVGHIVLEAGGAGEAITILEAHLNVDLVFSDVQMPGEMDGLGLARWVHAHRPGVKMILASGVVKASDAAGLCQHDAYLEKPYHEQQVAAQITTLLNARGAPPRF